MRMLGIIRSVRIVLRCFDSASRNVVSKSDLVYTDYGRTSICDHRKRPPPLSEHQSKIPKTFKSTWRPLFCGDDLKNSHCFLPRVSRAYHGRFSMLAVCTNATRRIRRNLRDQRNFAYRFLEIAS